MKRFIKQISIIAAVSIWAGSVSAADDAPGEVDIAMAIGIWLPSYLSIILATVNDGDAINPSFLPTIVANTSICFVCVGTGKVESEITHGERDRRAGQTGCDVYAASYYHRVSQNAQLSDAVKTLNKTLAEQAIRVEADANFTSSGGRGTRTTSK